MAGGSIGLYEEKECGLEALIWQTSMCDLRPSARWQALDPNASPALAFRACNTISGLKQGYVKSRFRPDSVKNYMAVSTNCGSLLGIPQNQDHRPFKALQPLPRNP